MDGSTDRLMYRKIGYCVQSVKNRTVTYFSKVALVIGYTILERF